MTKLAMLLVRILTWIGHTILPDSCYFCHGEWNFKTELHNVKILTCIDCFEKQIIAMNEAAERHNESIDALNSAKDIIKHD